MVRYPGWVNRGALKIILNGNDVPCRPGPSSYISIHRKWKKGDVVIIRLPMHNSIEYLPNLPQYIAFMHGPVLLCAKSGTENLKGIIADDSRFGQYAGGEKLPVDKAPVLIEDKPGEIANRLVPVKGQPLHFTLDVKMVNAIHAELIPFYQLHDARYMMYWLALTNAAYKSYTDSLAHIEEEKITIEKRTVDFVAPGEQQPETDHLMQTDKSGTGSNQNVLFRDARNDGYFSYQLSTHNETGLSLRVKILGRRMGQQKFDIYIDDEKLITEDNTGRWNQSQFKDIEYKIPDALIMGKSTVRIKFHSLTGNTAGAVYYVRLVKNEK